MKTRILYLGNNTANCEIMLLKLEHLLPNYALIKATDSINFLDQVGNGGIHAIISCYTDLKHTENLSACKIHFHHIPFIYIGKSISEKEILSLFRMGIDEFLDENNLDQTLEILSRLIERFLSEKMQTENQNFIYNRNLLLQTNEMTKTGIWRFDLATGKVVWDYMLYEIFEAELDYEPNYKDYISTINEKSRSEAVNSIQAALENKGSFTNQYSISTFKSNTKHIQSWGQAITDSDGNVTGLIGVCKDNTEQTNIKNELNAIIEISTTVGGTDYFKTITNLLSSHFGIKYVLIGEFFPDKNIVETLGFSKEGEITPNFSYSLEHSPCLNVYDNGLCIYPDGVQKLFPRDLSLKKLNIISYTGIPLIKNDIPIGIIVLMDTKPLTNSDKLISILNAIASKSATEIEQIRHVREIEKYERYFSISTDILCITSVEGDLLQVNPKFSKTLGYAENELLNQGFTNFVHPEDLEKTLKKISSLTQEETTCSFMNRYRCKGGDYLHLHWTTNIDFSAGLIYCAARNTNDLIEARQELINTSDKLRDIIEYANVGIAYAYKNGEIESLNIKFLEILEYKEEEEVIGMHFSDFTHPDDIEEDEASVAAILAGEIDTFAMEKRYITKHKKIKWIDLRVSTIFDKNRNVLNFVAMVIDITDKKESQKAKEESSKRLKLATSSAKIGIWDWNFVENILNWDDNMYALFDVRKGEFEENFEAWEKTAHKEDVESTTLLLQEAIKGEKTFDTQFRIVHKNGDIKHIKANAILEKNTKGDPIRIIGLNYDITEEIELLKKIKESEAKYRSLFDRINEGFLLTTSEGVILTVNPAFCKMLEFRTEELIGKQGYFLLADQGDVPMLRKKVEERKNGKFEQYDLSLKTKTGKVKWFKFSASPLLDLENKFVGVMSIVMDITGAKKMERIKDAFTEELEISVAERTAELSLARIELAKSLATEKELNNIKSKFVATASHQFRTPLTVIQSSMDILSIQRHLVDEEMLRIMDRVIKRVNGQIGKMVALMNDVLSLGKITEGNVKANKSRINLLELCESIVANYNEIFSDKCRMKFIVEGTPETLILDQKLVEHAISNLVSNAFKYSPKKSVLEFKISFNGAIQISVKDFGIGIPKDAFKNLFDPFFRAKNAENTSGTGLGTTIAKEYIEMNGGTIKVASELGKGSEFTVTFPSNCRTS
ncbi:MAG: PAS domain S-box-containing protein [Crocinitomix sp.]|jgi:PAS domain S-box-containing protein